LRLGNGFYRWPNISRNGNSGDGLRCQVGGRFGNGGGLEGGRWLRVKVQDLKVHQWGGFDDWLWWGDRLWLDCWLWLRFKVHHRGGFDDRFDGGNGLR
jgi:hypothetical protein